jgi:predicted DNA-binding protein with PD1-like motif
MQILRGEQQHMLRIVRGEEIMDSVQRFAQQEDLQHAVVLGLGAVMDVEIGAYIVEERRYIRKRLEGFYEVTNLTGNLAWVDGAPYLHAHVTLSDHDCQTLGGHLFRAICYATVELTIWPGRGRIERRMDDAIGLKLLHLPDSMD